MPAVDPNRIGVRIVEQPFRLAKYGIVNQLFKSGGGQPRGAIDVTLVVSQEFLVTESRATRLNADQAGNDGQQAFRAGRLVHIDVPKTIADGAQTQSLGKITFEIIRRDVDDVFTASDAELVEAMRFFAGRMKMIVEPTGCLGYAAARRMKDRLAGQRVGVILSGGNVDLARFAELTAS